MLTVYTRHSAFCPKIKDPNWRPCRCPKWIAGTIPGRAGKTLRMSAKTRAWENAEQLVPQI